LHLSGLKLRLFRNLGVQELSFPEEGVAIVGANAQGKSNLLEAIYYLEIFKSFRGSKLQNLVAFGEDVFRIEGTVESRNNGKLATQITAAYETSTRRRRITIDGSEPTRVIDAIGHLAAVVFSPADVGIVDAGPSARRRYLDVLLSLNREGYLESLQIYKHVLAQRNAALRSNADMIAVRAWDDSLALSASKIMTARAEWVAEKSEDFRKYYELISGKISASMSYVSKISIEDWSPEQVYAKCLSALEDSWSRDIFRRNTSQGPHLDELLLAFDGGQALGEIREIGSGGQRRTAALALRLIEGDTIQDSRGVQPILLLDDAFVELDDSRRERVLLLMDQDRFGQVIMTAPKESDVQIHGNKLCKWGIKEGIVYA
jgi:DNA replication and repair protein RecF